MDEFFAPFWNLDQVYGWAESRDPDIVRSAALPRYGPPKSAMHTDIRSTHSATKALRVGRDIGGELWAASGWAPLVRPFDPPPQVIRHAEQHGVPTYRAYSYENLRVEEPRNEKREGLIEACKFAAEADRALLVGILGEPDNLTIKNSESRLAKLPVILRRAFLDWLREPEVQGPPNVYFREPFPTLKYLGFLFQMGRMTATAQIPGDPRSLGISTADWSGLTIKIGGKHSRMSVWRSGQQETDGNGILRTCGSPAATCCGNFQLSDRSRRANVQGMQTIAKFAL